MPKNEDTLIFTFFKVGMERLWSPTTHPNLASHWKKKEKNTVVVSKDEPDSTEHKQKQSMISGVYLQVSFFVIMFKKDKIVRASRKLVSHPTQMYRCCPANKHDIGRIAGMSSGSPLERSWWTALIRAMDRFHPLHYIQWSPPRECTWSGRRLTKIQATSMSVNMWPEMWSGMSKQAQQRRRHWAEEKAKLAKMHESSKVFIASIQKARNSMKLWKMCERSWNYVWTLHCRAMCERPQGYHPQRHLRTHMRKLAMSTSRKKF